MSTIKVLIIVELQFAITDQLSEDLIMNDFYKDILTGTIFVTGLLGFISGEFIISSALFATAAIASNINQTRKRGKAGQIACE